MSLLPITTKLRYLARHFGLDIHRFSPETHPDPLFRFLHCYRVERVFDVGANEGQFGSFLRRQGYKGEIISFEPNPEAFERLKRNAAGDDHWQCFNLGFGTAPGIAELNVSEYSAYSSLLGQSAALGALDAKARVVRKVRVQIETFDRFIRNHGISASNALLKIDTQGFEKAVLEGAVSALQELRGVQLELSLKNIYEGQPLIEEMIPCMKQRGYALYAFNAGLSDRNTGELLETDGIFLNLCLADTAVNTQ